jgi:zinc protease
VEIARQEQVRLPYLRQPAWWTVLKTGHQIIVVPKPGDVVHLHTVVRTGSVNETDADTGISHFLEHLMFKGTARYPAGAFDRILEGVGARINASTSRDWTQYYATLPKGDAGAYYYLALDLHADMLLHAALPDEEIGPPFDPAQPPADKRERAVVLEEIKMGRDNPWRQALQRLTELLYPTHPYRREVIGTAQVVAGVPRATIEGYYRTWYQPSNMITILCGDFEPEAAIAEVAQYFAFPDAQPVAHPAFPAEAPPAAPRRDRLTMPLNVAYVVLGFLGPPSVELKATIGLDVLSLILGEGLSSRLHQRLVEGLPNTPFFDVGSTHWTYRDSSNVLGYGIVRPDAAEEAFDLLCGEVRRLHAEPPTAEELDKAVTRLEAQFAAQAETSAGIAVAIADSMARLNNPSNYIDYLEILHSLTRDDLAAYAAAYLPDTALCAVTVGPQ